MERVAGVKYFRIGLMQDHQMSIIYFLAGTLPRKTERCLTSEQRKQLLHLIINKVTIADNRNIESIQIQLNNVMVRHFTKQEEDKSSDNDDLSSSFSFCFNLCS